MNARDLLQALTVATTGCSVTWEVADGWNGDLESWGTASYHTYRCVYDAITFTISCHQDQSNQDYYVLQLNGAVEQTWSDQITPSNLVPVTDDQLKRFYKWIEEIVSRSSPNRHTTAN